MIEWGLLFVLLLLLAFIVSSLNKRYKRSRAARPARWKLFKDKPDDWKDAVYNPKGFRNKK